MSHEKGTTEQPRPRFEARQGGVWDWKDCCFLSPDRIAGELNGLDVAAPLPETGAKEPVIDQELLPRCDDLDGSSLRIVPSYTEAGYFCEANCITIEDKDGRRALYIPYKHMPAAPSPAVEMPALVMPVHRAYCQKASYRDLPCTCERRKGERRVKDNGPLFRNSPAGENPYAEDSRFRHDRRAVAPTPPNLESQVSSGVSHADLRAAISPAAHNAATGSVLDTAGIQSRPLDKRKYVASSGVIAGISDRVSLHVCRGNSDLLHDDEQFAACYQCNPPSAAPSEGHRKTLDKVVRGGITEGVEEAKRVFWKAMEFSAQPANGVAAIAGNNIVDESAR